MNSNDPKTLLQQGLEASQAGDSTTAVALWAKATAAAPGWGTPHFLMASELASTGDITAAEASFANAVILAPDLHIARYQLGLLQFSSSRVALALLTWQPLLVLPEVEALPHFVQGYAALAQDDFSNALRHFRTGMMLNANNPPLNADVALIVERIEATMQQNGDTTDQNAGYPSVNLTSVDDIKVAPESHVLLSNYHPTRH